MAVSFVAARLFSTGILAIDNTLQFDEISTSTARISTSGVYASLFDEVTMTSGSIYFNGSSYLDLANSNGSPIFSFGANNITIECWVYHTSIDGTQNYYRTQGSGSAAEYLFRQTAGTVEWGGYSAASVNLFNATSAASALTANTWYHVAVVRNGATHTIYVNGVASGTPTTASYTAAAPQQNIGIGRGNFSTGENMIGYISNIRVVNGAALYTSNFTPPNQPLSPVALVPTYLPTTGTIQTLVVAGGGAGGQGSGGGGGAGGYIYSATQTISMLGTYTITVGIGGVSASGTSAPGTGSNSLALGLTAIGGGAGGAANGGTAISAPTSGGSGGGGVFNNQTGGAGTSGQGTAGGTTADPASGYYGGAGGGGAFQAGQFTGLTTAGPGGAGTFTTIISTTLAVTLGVGQYVTATNAVYFAGGGAGGADGERNQTGAAGGLGGGGKGGSTTPGPINGTSGAPHTGGGGGGGENQSQGATNGGNGGSGVIIVSYPVTYSPMTIPGTLTYSLNTSTGNYIYVFTSGTGVISFNTTTVLSLAASSSLLLNNYSFQPFVDSSTNLWTLTPSGSPAFNTLTPFSTASMRITSSTNIQVYGIFDEVTGIL